MGKMSELAAELAELKHCGEILIGISESLTELFSAADSEPKATEEKTTEPPKTTEVKKLTVEEVRAAATEKSRGGNREQVVELLKKYGSNNISNLDPSHFEDFLKELEVL